MIRLLMAFIFVLSASQAWSQVVSGGTCCKVPGPDDGEVDPSLGVEVNRIEGLVKNVLPKIVKSWKECSKDKSTPPFKSLMDVYQQVKWLSFNKDLGKSIDGKICDDEDRSMNSRAVCIFTEENAKDLIVIASDPYISIYIHERSGIDYDKANVVAKDMQTILTGITKNKTKPVAGP